MIAPPTIQCDICKCVKYPTARWLVAVESSTTGAISFFSPSDLMQPLNRDIPNSRLKVVDLCGQECAHTWFSRWLEANPGATVVSTSSPESVTP